MVIGETSRAANWSIYGYNRNTNPELTKIKGLTAFSHVLTESNTTHKSVPMLMSSVTAHDFNSIYRQKELSQHLRKRATGLLSFPINAITILSSISLEKKPIYAISLKKMQEMAVTTLRTMNFLKLVAAELAENASKQFIVLHTYGSHFNYRERYPADHAFFA